MYTLWGFFTLYGSGQAVGITPRCRNGRRRRELWYNTENRPLCCSSLLWRQPLFYGQEVMAYHPGNLKYVNILEVIVSPKEESLTVLKEDRFPFSSYSI